MAPSYVWEMPRRPQWSLPRPLSAAPSEYNWLTKVHPELQLSKKSIKNSLCLESNHLGSNLGWLQSSTHSELVSCNSSCATLTSSNCWVCRKVKVKKQTCAALATFPLVKRPAALWSDRTWTILWRMHGEVGASTCVFYELVLVYMS